MIRAHFPVRNNLCYQLRIYNRRLKLIIFVTPWFKVTKEFNILLKETYSLWSSLTQFRLAFFGAAHGLGWGQKGILSKIGHTNSIMMKVGTAISCLRKIQTIYKSRDTSLDFRLHQLFLTRNWQLLLYQKIQILIAFYKFLILLTFFEFLKIVLISIIVTLMMSAKLATLPFLK